MVLIDLPDSAEKKSRRLNNNQQRQELFTEQRRSSAIEQGRKAWENWEETGLTPLEPEDRQTIAKCLGKKIEDIKKDDGKGALTKLLKDVMYLAQPMSLKHLDKLTIKPGGKLKKTLRPPPDHTNHLFKPLQNIQGKIYMSWPTRCCFLRSSIQSEKFNSKKLN